MNLREQRQIRVHKNNICGCYLSNQREGSYDIFVIQMKYVYLGMTPVIFSKYYIR